METNQKRLMDRLLGVRFFRSLSFVALGMVVFAQSALPAMTTEPLHVLLQRIENGATFQERLLAAEAIRAYGEVAVPRLTELLFSADEQAQQFAALGLVRIGRDAAMAVPDLIAILARHDLAIRHDAVVALETIGPAAAPAIAALQDLADDPDTRLASRAIDALAAIRTPEAIQALTVFLHADEQRIQMHALLTIRGLGPATGVILPELLDLGIHGPSFAMREQAFCIVSLLGEDAVPSLVMLLETGSPEARRHAAMALFRTKTNNTDAMTMLRYSLQDSDRYVRFWAARALGAVGPLDDESRLALARAKADSDPNVRWAASRALNRAADRL